MEIKTIHRSLGLATRPAAKATWKEVAKGPCRRKVRDHRRRVTSYHKMFG